MAELELIDRKKFRKKLAEICEKRCDTTKNRCDNCDFYKVYEMLEDMQSIKIVEDKDNPSSAAFGDSSSFEELSHRAEVFERMAFKLSEELEAAKEYIKSAPIFPPCGVCLYKDEDEDGEHCKDCTKRNCNFIFFAEKARET